MASCLAEPPAQEDLSAIRPEPEPYLYKPPTTTVNGLPSDSLKKEALAEAFVSRLSTKAPAGVVVLRQEKLVLEEYFGKDSTAFFCAGDLFPPYVGALLGSTAMSKSSVPYSAIPLENIYPTHDFASSITPSGTLQSTKSEHTKEALLYLDALIEKQTGTTPGMAAEEYLFEPLQVDDYKWTDEALWMHPHDALKLGSLWVRRGRWGNEQILPDLLVQRVLAPAYDASTPPAMEAFGWQYYRLVAKGRKQPVLYWKGQGAHLFLLPEVESVILLQGDDSLMPEAWDWIQQYLIPSLVP